MGYLFLGAVLECKNMNMTDSTMSIQKFQSPITLWSSSWTSCCPPAQRHSQLSHQRPTSEPWGPQSKLPKHQRSMSHVHLQQQYTFKIVRQSSTTLKSPDAWTCRCHKSHSKSGSLLFARAISSVSLAGRPKAHGTGLDPLVGY
jgi:hypothetical protein